MSSGLIYKYQSFLLRHTQNLGRKRLIEEGLYIKTFVNDEWDKEETAVGR